MEQETPSLKKYCLGKMQIILLVIGVFSALLTMYYVASPPMKYGPDHPLYADYASLFYNTKCSHTKGNYTEYDILDELYHLGIPKDRAEELFIEAKDNLERGVFMYNMVGVEENCSQETLEYYNKALNVLKYLSNRADRAEDGFPESFNR
ncbi:MAG: hypothetical protein EOM18_14815 [Clostridia bacterium]|nr:hypothetical protein [Clostridia bacterium]